jgi:hypothetical protein
VVGKISKPNVPALTHKGAVYPLHIENHIYEMQPKGSAG